MRAAPTLSLLALTGSLLVACGGEEKRTETPTTKIADGPVRVLNSIPRFRLRDQDDKPFSSGELSGKVWIATFIFTGCKQTCPAQTAELAKIQSALSKHAAADQIHLVSFTVDPANDTAAVLRAYAEKNGADPKRWTFLTGDREALWSLSKDGFKLPVSEAKDDPSVLIAHSQNFILVDRARRVRGHYDALDAGSRARLLRDLDVVLTDPPGPVLARKTVPDDDTPGQRVYQPKELRGALPWMKEREQAQRKTLPQFQVFHDFRFTDRQPESGITFVNKVVDDAAKYYKGVHYDHGNGVAVADVDGDGRLDVYFVTQLGSNQLCRNLGGGRFADVTAAAGVAVSDRIGVTASFADIDNDGDPDLFVTTVRGGNLLFENDGKGKFTDISKSSGLDYVGHSSSAVFFDYDKDGLVDLFVCNPGKYTTERKGTGDYYVGFVDGFEGHLHADRTERSLLYRNLGERRFEDVAEKVGLLDESWTGAASPIDLNEDGWQDLYVLSMEGHDEYYENVGGERFTRKSRTVFPKTPWGAMGIKVFDFDNDGRMDIYVTDMHTDMTDELVTGRRYWYAEKMKIVDMFPPAFLATDNNHVLGNAFFHNQGNGKFEEISDRIGAENYWPWGLSVDDLNADGFDDAFVASSMNFPFRYGVNSLLLNNRGERFLDSEFIVGVEPRRDGATSKLWFELDMDGVDKENPYGKGHTGKVEVFGALGTRSSVIFDLDDDGDLDIVTNEFHSVPLVLVSNLSEKNKDLHYLKVRLVGSKSNRDGLGARVQVKVGDKTLTKVNDGQSGYLSQSSCPLYFGLDAAAKIDAIEVRWPSGATQKLAGPIEADRLLTITEAK